MKIIKVISFILAIVLLVNGCKKDYETTKDLDKILENVLLNSSNQRGITHYLLPESHEFAKIPQDPKNPLTKNKVELGKLLYHETGLGLKSKYKGGNSTFSCASCHHARAGFQAGVSQGIGDGGLGFGLKGEKRVKDPNCLADSVDVQPIRSPSTLNSAYQELMLWNGQFGGVGKNIGTENQWTQGTPLENNKLGFHGVETQAIAGLSVHRLEIDSLLVQSSIYKDLFNQAFPEYPISIRYSKITAGLAIAAYERTLLANKAPFQLWLKGDYAVLSENQKKGGITFFSKG